MVLERHYTATIAQQLNHELAIMTRQSIADRDGEDTRQDGVEEDRAYIYQGRAR